jgi:hypothetical protein
VLSGLWLSDDPGIVNARACFGCRGNKFTGRYLEMDFSGPAISAFSRHITITIAAIPRIPFISSFDNLQGVSHMLIIDFNVQFEINLQSNLHLSMKL